MSHQMQVGSGASATVMHASTMVRPEKLASTRYHPAYQPPKDKPRARSPPGGRPVLLEGRVRKPLYDDDREPEAKRVEFHGAEAHPTKPRRGSAFLTGVAEDAEDAADLSEAVRAAVVLESYEGGLPHASGWGEPRAVLRGFCDRIRMGKHRGFATWLTEDYDQKFSEDLSEAGGEVVVTLEELLQAAQLYQVRPHGACAPMLTNRGW